MLGVRECHVERMAHGGYCKPVQVFTPSVLNPQHGHGWRLWTPSIADVGARRHLSTPEGLGVARSRTLPPSWGFTLKQVPTQKFATPENKEGGSYNFSENLDHCGLMQ